MRCGQSKPSERDAATAGQSLGLDSAKLHDVVKLFIQRAEGCQEDNQRCGRSSPCSSIYHPCSGLLPKKLVISVQVNVGVLIFSTMEPSWDLGFRQVEALSSESAEGKGWDAWQVASRMSWMGQECFSNHLDIFKKSDIIENLSGILWSFGRWTLPICMVFEPQPHGETTRRFLLVTSLQSLQPNRTGYHGEWREFSPFFLSQSQISGEFYDLSQYYPNNIGRFLSFQVNSIWRRSTHRSRRSAVWCLHKTLQSLQSLHWAPSRIQVKLHFWKSIPVKMMVFQIIWSIL